MAGAAGGGQAKRGEVHAQAVTLARVDPDRLAPDLIGDPTALDLGDHLLAAVLAGNALAVYPRLGQ